ncbi:hypothetical protein Tsubulata_030183, partial [Turnera subulata]
SSLHRRAAPPPPSPSHRARRHLNLSLPHACSFPHHRAAAAATGRRPLLTLLPIPSAPSSSSSAAAKQRHHRQSSSTPPPCLHQQARSPSPPFRGERPPCQEADSSFLSSVPLNSLLLSLLPHVAVWTRTVQAD